MTANMEPQAETTNVNLPTEEQLDQIRRRAYELYEARGREDGHDMEDWLEAETEILSVKPLVTDL